MDNIDSGKTEIKPLQEVDPNDNQADAPDESAIVNALKELPHEPDNLGAENESAGSENLDLPEINDRRDDGDDGEDEAVSVQKLQQGQGAAEDDISELVETAKKSRRAGAKNGKRENDFLRLSDDEADNNALEKEKITVKNTQKPEKQPDDDNPEKKTEAVEKSNSQEKSTEDSQADDDATQRKSTRKTATKKSLSKSMILLVLLTLIVGCYFVYSNFSIIRFKIVSQPDANQGVDLAEPTRDAEKPVPLPQPSSKQEILLATLGEAVELREKLLQKYEEIYDLKLHYQSGIIELEEQVVEQMQETGITAYAQAIANKPIELKLRTIQRRQAYIRELKKPAEWIERGTEELLYLNRKAQFDLQLIDVAGGIDLDRHVRHLNAAIQKYRPTGEKLAIEPQNADLPTLKTIWDRVNKQKESTERMPLQAKDQAIIEEICSGKFDRSNELSSMRVKAAKCLAKMDGSDLFLNGLTHLSPRSAKFIFQWPGNWICLNGIKELSPTAAQYAFKWQGEWLSLNGLSEFPPELGPYLLKWKGKQLELMGLGSGKKKTDKTALKYLNRWEKSGGKVFVSDDIRKEMEAVRSSP